MNAITSIIGGVQGASAAHDGSTAVQTGDQQAGQTMTAAKDSANSTIQGAVNSAAGNAVDASQKAGDTEMTVAQQGGAQVTGAAQAAGAGVDPYAATGAAATGKAATIADAMSQPYTAQQMMSEDPGYAFRLQQGQLALQRAQAATGGVLGGAGAKALASYTQNDASNEYATAFAQHMQTQQAAYAAQKGLADAGEQAAEYAGTAGLQGAEFGASTYDQAANLAGAQQLQGSEYAGSTQMQGAGEQSGNDMATGQYVGNTQMAAGQAKAAGDLGAANAWNGMLSGIGAAADSFLAGGFGGGGGFNLTGAMTGIPQYGRAAGGGTVPFVSPDQFSSGYPGMAAPTLGAAAMNPYQMPGDWTALAGGF